MIVLSILSLKCSFKGIFQVMHHISKICLKRKTINYFTKQDLTYEVAYLLFQLTLQVTISSYGKETSDSKHGNIVRIDSCAIMQVILSIYKW